MAVVTKKSTAITNRDATPRVISNPGAARGMVMGFLATAAIASGDSAASKILFGSIPSNAVVRSLKVSAPDIGTTTTMDLGLYRTTDDAGAVVDADFFVAALSLKDGAIADSEQAFGNVITKPNVEKRVWELLGLASDPSIVYDVVGTLVGAADAAGDVVVKAEYAV